MLGERVAGSTSHFDHLSSGTSREHLETWRPVIFLSSLPCKVLTILVPSPGSPGREGAAGCPTGLRGPREQQCTW